MPAPRLHPPVCNLERLGRIERQFLRSRPRHVDQEIKDWLKSNGSRAWANFLKAMNQQSPIAPADGNPTSMTAFMASQTYADFATAPSLTREEKEAGSPSTPNGLSLGFVADYGHYETKGFNGNTYSLPLFAKLKFNDRVTLAINLPLRYTDTEGAKIYSVGLGLGLPVKIIKAAKNQPWTWILTPSASARPSAPKHSSPAVSSPTVAYISSMVSYDFTHLTLSMGNQYARYQGVPMTVGTITLDPGVDKQSYATACKSPSPLAAAGSPTPTASTLNSSKAPTSATTTPSAPMSVSVLVK